MKQFNAAWMNGVGMITEWPTEPRDAFRSVKKYIHIIYTKQNLYNVIISINKI